MKYIIIYPRALRWDGTGLF